MSVTVSGAALFRRGGDHSEMTAFRSDGATRLREGQLYVQCPEATDAGLIHMRELAELKILALGVTSITEAGLIHPRTTAGTSAGRSVRHRGAPG
jgi:hypothetical protein